MKLSPSLFQKWIANLAIVLFSVILTFIIADSIYGYLVQFNMWSSSNISMYSDYRFYKPHPYTMFNGSPGENTGLGDNEVFNELGYRGLAPEENKPPGEFRVFIVGGSTVLGGEADYTIPVNLQKIMHENGFKNVQVYNFGAASSGSGQGLARILYEIVNFEPDLVIMYNGVNDFEHPFFRDPRPGYPFNFLVTEANPVYLKRPEDFPLAATLLYRSAILRDHLRGFFEREFAKRDEIAANIDIGSSKWLEQIVEKYWEYLTKSKKISEAFNADFIGIFQPFAYFKEPRFGQEKQYGKIYQPHFFALRELLYQKMKMSPETELIDMSEFFSGYNEQVFTDTCHIIEKFKKDVALRFFELIQSRKDVFDRLEAAKVQFENSSKANSNQ